MHKYILGLLALIVVVASLTAINSESKVPIIFATQGELATSSPTGHLIKEINSGRRCEELDRATDFIVFGDTQPKNEYEWTLSSKVIGAIAKQDRDLIIHTGDHVENSGRREEWDKYFNMIDPIYDENYFAVVGNHDVENNYALWHKYWDLPNNERWYSFDRGGAHFIVVDNVNSRDTWGSLGAEQEAWLDADLEDNCDEASFCFVFMHVPPVSWNEGLALNGQRWLSLLRQHGVDAIFAGHIHNYERGNYGDIGFVTTAGGGNKFHKLKDLPVADKTLTELNHFVKISTSEDRTIGCVYDLQGDEIDSFEILKR